MRVLITGGGGQVARALLATAPSGARVEALSRTELDITRGDQIEAALHDRRPDVVLNTAALTAVDDAESSPDLAREVNAAGAARLAEAVGVLGARMIHLGTDYVFDGAQGRPYRTGDPARPLNVYGRTKLEGERAVLAALGSRALVVRTAWVYSSCGKNFVRTMLRLLSVQPSVDVVCDQIGTPTWATSLARAVWAAAVRPALAGVLHWTDAGVASWYDFAVAIREEALAAGRLSVAGTVVAVPSAAHPTPARRPPFTVLDCSATREAVGLSAEHWRVNLRLMLREATSG